MNKKNFLLILCLISFHIYSSAQNVEIDNYSVNTLVLCELVNEAFAITPDPTRTHAHTHAHKRRRKGQQIDELKEKLSHYARPLIVGEASNRKVPQTGEWSEIVMPSPSFTDR